MTSASPAKTFRLLLGASILIAGAAILFASAYLQWTGAPMHPAVLLAALLGVGLTVAIAGGLGALLYHGARDGHHARAGNGFPQRSRGQ